MHLFALCVSWSTRMSSYEPETKQQFSMKEDDAWVQEHDQEWACFFFLFHIHKDVYCEFIFQDQTVRAEFYSNFLKRWRLDTGPKSPKRLCVPSCHYLAARRAIKNVGAFWSLPDLTPCDFILFTKLKFKLKGHCCDTAEIKHLQVVWMGLPG